MLQVSLGFTRGLRVSHFFFLGRTSNLSAAFLCEEFVSS